MDRRILLVGKLNKVLRNLNEILERTFNMQLCAYELDLVKGMTKIFKPDMVIISTSELNHENPEIFDYYFGAYRKIPVIVVGTQEECEHYKGYLESDQFEKMVRPVGKNQLITKCCEVMNISPEEAEKEKNDAVKKAAAKKKQSAPRKTIMIVDDSSLAVRSTKAMLEKQYNIMVATSGLKAIEFMHKKKPDLVLLDYDMPKFDGKDTLQHMRSDDNLKDIPVFFLTAIADTKHITAVLKLNPEGYFLKPLEKEKVLAAIEEHLG
ncbi:MAG: response regulator [Lachnospiraceae bacterium]|nr:response regulator [Lachnospiraceae bacterium]MBQ9233096.1 response regulator [Lachnospiraceae bacterium]